LDRRDVKSKLYERIALVLMVGIIASIGIMVFGLVVLIVKGGASNGNPRDLGQLITGILNLDASSIIWFGTIILILTPITRIITSTLLFIEERDTKYFIITLTVLILIIISFLVGIALTEFKLS
jgi:uncharacterized membrane protein